jgi:hypothetical protein
MSYNNLCLEAPMQSFDCCLYTQYELAGLDKTCLENLVLRPLVNVQRI